MKKFEDGDITEKDFDTKPERLKIIPISSKYPHIIKCIWSYTTTEVINFFNTIQTFKDSSQCHRIVSEHLNTSVAFISVPGSDTPLKMVYHCIMIEYWHKMDEKEIEVFKKFQNETL